jgi:hypothetical protein
VALLAPEDPVPEPIDTNAAGLVGVLALAEPDAPVSALEAPSEPAVAPPAVSVLPLSEVPVAGAAGAVVVLPVAGMVDPAGVLVELPTSLPVPDVSVPVAEEAGPALDPLVVEGGTGSAALALLTEDGWVVERTRAACLTTGRDGAGGAAGWAGAAAAVAEI